MPQPAQAGPSSQSDKYRYIGKAVPRVEDARFLTGRGRYTDDHALEGQVHCAFLRSPHAHALIRGIDASAALAMPGVLAVLTGADWTADGLGLIEHAANPADALDVKQRAFGPLDGVAVPEIPHGPLAIGRARFVGEPVAAVVALTAGQARDAVEQLHVDWEPLGAVVSPLDAVAPGAPLIWDAAPGNRCFTREFGDAAAARAAIDAAPLVLRHVFEHNRVANAQMEPRSALGDFDAATGAITLISGSQGVTKQQMTLAAIFRLPMDKVRVVCPDTGGGFGPRTNLYPEQAVVVWAAMRLNRPVRWTGERSECFLSDYQGRDGVATAEIGFDRDGRILGYDVDLLAAVGAHAVSYVTASNGMRMLTTVYHVPAAHISVSGVLTNTVPTAPYRGAGRPEAIHVIERLLDMAAGRLGLDRAEIRRRNLVTRAMLPYRSPMGLTYDSGDFPDCMDKALAAADWDGFAARRDEARSRGRLAGIAVANHLEAPVGAPVERVIIDILPDGRVDVIVGTQSTGQGHETSFAQVAADLLGTDMDCVRVRYGDSDFVKLGGGTHSDRSMRIAGAMLVKSAGEIIAKARAAAAAKLEVAAEDIAWQDGAYRVLGTDRAVGLLELARAVGAGELPADMRALLAATADFFGRIPAFPCGAAVCELEVDPDTGGVQVTRYTAVDDAGQVVNPMIVDGQTHGGIVQGVGQALGENANCERDTGQVVAGSFMDYRLMRAADFPSFVTAHVEDRTHAAGNALHVKGGGEGGISPATAVVINALVHALAEKNVEDLPMPATPMVVWRAVHASQVS